MSAKPEGMLEGRPDSILTNKAFRKKSKNLLQKITRENRETEVDSSFSKMQIAAFDAISKHDEHRMIPYKLQQDLRHQKKRKMKTLTSGDEFLPRPIQKSSATRGIKTSAQHTFEWNPDAGRLSPLLTFHSRSSRQQTEVEDRNSKFLLKSLSSLSLSPQKRLSVIISTSNLNEDVQHFQNYQMRNFKSSLLQFEAQEAQLRVENKNLISRELSTLPLNFLFKLPGGAAYCRVRLQQAFSLWVSLFQQSQKKVYLYHWKDITVSVKFQEQQRNNREAALSRILRTTIKFISKRLQTQALVKWIEATRWMIWSDRHNASIMISRLWRGYNNRKRILHLHHSLQSRREHFQDIRLAPTRPLVRFKLLPALRNEVLNLWSAVVTIQKRERFKSLQRFVRTRTTAIITIQAHIRQFETQKRYSKLIRAFTKTQSIYRMWTHRREYLRLRRSALILQRSFRFYHALRIDHIFAHLKILQLEKEWTASILLQRFARGFLARIIRIRLQEELKIRFIAALKIQRCWYRHNGESSTFVLLCCLREEEERENATRKATQKLRRWKCAATIQSHYRRHRQRVLDSATIRLQCFSRQWISRKIAQQKRREIAAQCRIKNFFRTHYRKRNAAALKLQLFWLKKTKRIGRHLHERRARIEEQERYFRKIQECGSVTRIQAMVRGFLVRRRAGRIQALKRLRRFVGYFFAWRAFRKRRIRWKTAFAASFAASSIEAGFKLATKARFASNSRFVIRIQQLYRGFQARQKLIKAASSERRNEAVVRSIQSYWRYARQCRLVARAIAIRRRQRSNPASNLCTVSDVLAWTTESISTSYNHEDELCGMSALEWFYRIGIPKQVTSVIAKNVYFNEIAGNDFPNCLRKLGASECERIFRSILHSGAKFLHPNQIKEIIGDLLASLFGYIVKQKADLERRNLKRENQLLSVLQHRYQSVNNQLQKEGKRHNEIQRRLETIDEEAKVFRRLPNALKKEHLNLSEALNRSGAQVKQTTEKHSDLKSTILRQESVIKDQQKVVVRIQKKEVIATYDLDRFQLVDTTSSIAQKLFLERFPRLQTHASKFSKSLHGMKITKWQFQRFFNHCDSIGRVSSFMALLTDLHTDERVRNHNSMRFDRVIETLQCGIEKICELLGLPFLFIVTATSSQPFVPRPSFLLDRFLLWILQKAHYARLLEDGVKIWNRGFEAISMLDSSAGKLQAHWKRRMTQTRILQEERNKQEQRWLGMYLEERNCNYVALHWQQERVKEQKLIEMQKYGVQHASMEALRSGTTRFPYLEQWDEQNQQVVYINSKDGNELLLDRPTYTESEVYKVLRLQKAYRTFVARKEWEWQLRRLERDERKRALQLQWIQKRGTHSGPVKCSIRVTPSEDSIAAIWWAKHLEGICPTSKRASDIQNCHNALQHSYDHTIRNKFFTPLTSQSHSIVALISAYEKFCRSLTPSVIKVQIECTQTALRYGWTAVVQGQKRWYYQLNTHQYSTNRPEYEFDEEFAAIQVQTLGRRFIARSEYARLLSSVSIVDCMHEAISEAEMIGWIGFGYEGMKVSVFLDRLALSSHRDTLRSSTLYAKDVLYFDEIQWRRLLGNLQTQELDILYQRPCVKTKRNRYPLTFLGFWSTLPSEHHPFHFIASDRVLHSLLTKAYPNQRSSVASLRDAIKKFYPVTYRQLEAHVQRYAGRPDDALRNLSSINDGSLTASEEHEKLIFHVFLRAVQKCIVYCAILDISRLRSELSVAVAVVRYAMGIDNVKDQGIPYVAVSTDQVAAHYQAFVSQFAKRAVRGCWERPPSDTVPRLTYAQAALYLRTEVIERALIWVRSALVVQSLFRMRSQQKIYRVIQATRSSSAFTIQCNWRMHTAKVIHHTLSEQLRSDYEQCFAVKTKNFFYIHRPSMMRMEDPPRDADGELVPYRPMIQDKLTGEWKQAWPNAERKETDRTRRDLQVSTMCFNCHSSRAAWRCEECFGHSGASLHYCIACFIECHNVAVYPERSGHSYTLMDHSTLKSLVCVECGRYSTMRCLTCQEHYCRRCFDRIHRGGSTRKTHLCEFYQEEASVCDECQNRIAVLSCSTCKGVLCEECMRLTGHHRGRKAHHHVDVIQQRLEPGEKFCGQCFARRSEVNCSHCRQLLCHVCHQGSHAYLCGEAAYYRLKAQFDSESMCVECGEPGDRKCIKCGDMYCSNRRIGQLDCFEKFHQRGNRLRHKFEPVEPPPFSERLREWKEKRAEAVAVAPAKVSEHLPVMQSDSDTRKRVEKAKKNEANSAMWSHCRARNCGAVIANAKVFYCLKHMTPQAALEVSRKDPKEAAKLLIDLEMRAHKQNPPNSTPGESNPRPQKHVTLP